MSPPIITIDGPAASGKSSVSRELAKKLGFKWVSTGAFYRGLAYVALKEGLWSDQTASGDPVKLAQLASSRKWSVKLEHEQTLVFYLNQDVTREILDETNGSRASKMSQLPEVRQALLQNQRDCVLGSTGLIAEGRDCGTVVFPNAILKVYLTASQEERAIRRAREQGLNIRETQSQQIQRDRQDSSRTAAPMQMADDAKLLDSGGMPFEKVVETISQWAKAALTQSVKSF